MGAPYAILGVDIDLTQMYRDILYKTLNVLLIIIVIGAIFIYVFLVWTSRNITNPIELLEKSAIRYIEQSKSVSSPDKLVFEKPSLDIENEVESLSNTIGRMTDNIKDYMLLLISAEKETAHMRQLANTDPLTGVRNKLAYDESVESINAKISKGRMDDFGIIMMDINLLKKINDTYGHEYGDLLIKNFCSVVCDVFVHSPVYRIGGDEFVVILRNRDLANADKLLSDFEENISRLAARENVKPWEAPSVAVGVSYFDKSKDSGVKDVFHRADDAMYKRKMEMRVGRTD
jgi:diguanylate cyclase (GGDEF)-like protein